MDNVSHTVAGLLLAEAAIQLRAARSQEPSRSFARAAFRISALANNLPDFDFVYAGITRPEPLGYLLHHRGHTHTLLVALALAAAMLGAWAVFGRRFRMALRPGEWRWLVGLGVLGCVVHIIMDSTNNYGVHPFWPLYDGWLYGDFVFIIEPLFLVIGIPPLLAALRSRIVRALLALVLGGVVVLAWFPPRDVVGPVSGVATVVTVTAALCLLFAKTQPPGRRIAMTFAAALSVALAFFVLRGRASARAQAALPENAHLEDIVLTPQPANPLCWSLWRVSSQGSDYVAQRGLVAALPWLLPVERCSAAWRAPKATAPLTQGRFASSALELTGEFRAPIAELSRMNRDSCFVAAFLRFARVPFWTGTGHGDVVGDLRYDRGAAPEFAELVIPSSGECPRWLPSWLPPRRALLQ